MTTSIENTKGAADKIVLSIDAMGGDRGPAAVVAGVARAAKQNGHLHFIIHGKKSVLDLQVAKRRALWGRVDIRDTSDVVSMDDKPSQVLRSGKKYLDVVCHRFGAQRRSRGLRFLWQYRCVNGAQRDPFAQASRREPPRDRDPMAV